MSYRQRMQDKLTAALKPDVLEILDDSARHAGHAGHNPLGETHFKLKIVCQSFEGLGRVARHRLVYAAITEEMQERVHALEIEALTLIEYNRR